MEDYVPPEDYISRLPDSIIIDEILSRLPAKDAVTTGVLSSRWKNLWSSNPNLSFGLFDVLQGYASFVNKTLALYNSSNKSWLDQWAGTRNKLEISIPSVTSLELSGNWRIKCVLLDASSLIETNFERFSLGTRGDIQVYAATVKEMLLKVTSVSELRVGTLFLRAIMLNGGLTSSGSWASTANR
ncbi:hypothetical protein COLO4_31582 [Corchorus olitorius]|uniref:F-box domain-containing protein n=1 Tax=Corchorus olitorius TaxID=93759 RepID=A0A1R3H450_9ROSI|nr:hypothetical protein COLO4_31582 [Corchorus olitorius]